MNKKSIHIVKPMLPDFDAYLDEISSVWDTLSLTNFSDRHIRLESKLSDYLNIEFVNIFSNGHLALETALDTMELTGEVITTPFTFASTTHAIVRQGLTPVFCDIKKSDYNLNPSKIEELISENTSAIMPVHVYGNPCDVYEIERIAKKHNLKVIYDAAHAVGVEVDGKGIGNFGNLAMFSFHATKVFHTIEGGALTYSDSELTSKLNALKNFGITGPEEIEYVGGNAKMDEFRAAMGLCNLETIDEEIAKRGQIVKQYEKWLSNVEGIKLVRPDDNVKRNYAYMPVLFDGYKKHRDEVLEELKENNIYARKYFYPLTSDFDCYKDKFDSSKTPVAKHVADNILTLPLYGELSLEDVDRICNIILR